MTTDPLLQMIIMKTNLELLLRVLVYPSDQTLLLVGVASPPLTYGRSTPDILLFPRTWTIRDHGLGRKRSSQVKIRLFSDLSFLASMKMSIQSPTETRGLQFQDCHIIRVVIHIGKNVWYYWSIRCLYSGESLDSIHFFLCIRLYIRQTLTKGFPDTIFFPICSV